MGESSMRSPPRRGQAKGPAVGAHLLLLMGQDAHIRPGEGAAKEDVAGRHVLRVEAARLGLINLALQ